MGAKPEFLEKDPDNDPKFSRVFNDKPGHELLFQTTPIYVDALIQAKCVQCHQPTQTALQGIANSTTILAMQRERKSQSIQASLNNEKKALLELISLRKLIKQKGFQATIETLKAKQNDLSLSPDQIERIGSQLKYLNEKTSTDNSETGVEAKLKAQILSILGSQELANDLEKKLEESKNSSETLDQFLNENRTDPNASGTIFSKLDTLNLDQELMRHVQDTESSFSQTVADENVISAISADVDELTKNYQNGQQLFISQACYACHRIAGLARGGVGPELTLTGDNYPWFVKESIVWPQADLKTSTMPNYRLDHEELQDLVTFLLGQKGGSKAISPTAYKIGVQEWEAGKKMAWEKPISPSEIRNLRYSMTVFATEGCAACHRLKGFESNVGYRIEKEEKTSFDALYEESQWFKNLFPETIIGSELVKRIEAKGQEIDQRIAADVRKGSILEEIEKSHPHHIEALYSNFKFASRAKNKEFKIKADAEKDREKKKAILNEQKAWKERVHRVLMMYVQEYGLGRLIGPRPNWSGVYRSDEWLMEHFYNPSSHVPRSIMPIFPFDATKFYALTYMLDVLGKKNRDSVRQIWEHRGFDPVEAFSLFCSQCHGDFLQGNGPVSEWIYPIPKNLRNAFFLRNLTKEKALQSIMHGVKGTPMPPWSETPVDKSTADGVPVVTEAEAKKIVDWIYSSLPGGNVIRSQEDVPKWNYFPKDVIEELKNEGNQLKSGDEQKPGEMSENKSGKSLKELGRYLSNPQWNEYFVDLHPKVSVQEDNEVANIFDVVPNPVPGGEKQAYYIKKKYFTADNIEAGKHFFELNCAVCHGKEADGSGARAGVMQDAKPRMLTNLDWLDTRDDLRLLRSIKYGVVGTSMTPWGDLTSSLQRLQLVIYIRTLSEAQEKRKQLFSQLFKTFEQQKSGLDLARATVYPEIEKIQEQIRLIRQQQSNFYNEVEQGKPVSKEPVELYERELQLAEQLKKYKDADQLIQEMKNFVDKDKEIFSGIGINLFSDEPDSNSWEVLINIIKLKENEFTFHDGDLSFNVDPAKEQELNHLVDELVKQIDRKIEALESERTVAEGKIYSQERAAQLQVIKGAISNYTKLKARLLSGIRENTRIAHEQQQLFNQFQEKIKTLNQKKTTHG